MTGYEAFGLYESLKLHFAKDSYDFFKYNGKTNISITAFENRKDKYHFYKLSRKLSNRDELITFIVANLMVKDNLWVGDLLTEDAEVNFRSHQKVLQSFSYIFENDCKEIFDGSDDPNMVLKVIDGDYPVLLTKTFRKEIHIESFAMMARILPFMGSWSKQITDTIRWPTFQMKVRKLMPFLPQDDTKYKLILKKVTQK
jgi:hypothetical protein